MQEKVVKNAKGFESPDVPKEKPNTGQQLIPVPMSNQFVDALHEAMPQMGYGKRERSRFIREAIYEKMARLGVHVDRQLSLAPNSGEPGKVIYKIEPTVTEPALAADADATLAGNAAAADVILSLGDKLRPKAKAPPASGGGGKASAPKPPKKGPGQPPSKPGQK